MSRQLTNVKWTELFSFPSNCESGSAIWALSTNEGPSASKNTNIIQCSYIHIANGLSSDDKASESISRVGWGPSDKKPWFPAGKKCRTKARVMGPLLLPGSHCDIWKTENAFDKHGASRPNYIHHIYGDWRTTIWWWLYKSVFLINSRDIVSLLVHSVCPAN